LRTITITCDIFKVICSSITEFLQEVYEKEGKTLCDIEQTRFDSKMADYVEHMAIANAMMTDAIGKKEKLF
jgi:hypothetical protein